MDVIVRGTKEKVSLTGRFLASGGQGSVYVIGSRAFKIYSSSADAIPIGKIDELSAVSSSRVLAPIDVVLSPSDHNPIGYVMRYGEGSPLPTLYPKKVRQLRSIDSDVVLRLLSSLKENIGAIHDCGVVLADLNEFNVLSSKDLSYCYNIDLDSARTKSYPATAIMPAFRDPTSQEFTQLTDWYSFGLIAFSFLVGVHPFKCRVGGFTPKQVIEKMKAGVSALSPGAKMAATCQPLTSIPPRFRNWMEEIFSNGGRSAPPSDWNIHSVAMSMSVPVAPVIASGAVTFDLLVSIPATTNVVFVGLDDQGLFVVGDDGVVYRRGAQKITLGFTPSAVVYGYNGCFVVKQRGRLLTFYDISASGEGREAFTMDEVQGYSCSDGRLHIHRGDGIFEVKVMSMGGSFRGVASKISSAPFSTVMFPGLSIQPMLGAVWATLFPIPGGMSCRVRLKEIEAPDVRVIDAMFVGKSNDGVLCVLTSDGGTEYTIHTWHGLDGSGFKRYDSRIVDSPQISLVYLDTGVAVTGTSNSDSGDDDILKLFAPGRTESTIVRLGSHHVAMFGIDRRLVVGQTGGLYHARMSK